MSWTTLCASYSENLNIFKPGKPSLIHRYHCPQPCRPSKPFSFFQQRIQTMGMLVRMQDNQYLPNHYQPVWPCTPDNLIPAGALNTHLVSFSS